MKKSVKMELTKKPETEDKNMLYNNFTEELLGLQDVKVTNIEKKRRGNNNLH